MFDINFLKPQQDVACLSTKSSQSLYMVFYEMKPFLQTMHVWISDIIRNNMLLIPTKYIKKGTVQSANRRILKWRDVKRQAATALNVWTFVVVATYMYVCCVVL